MAIEWMLFLPRTHLKPAAEDGEKTSLKNEGPQCDRGSSFIDQFYRFCFFRNRLRKKKMPAGIMEMRKTIPIR